MPMMMMRTLEKLIPFQYLFSMPLIRMSKLLLKPELGERELPPIKRTTFLIILQLHGAKTIASNLNWFENRQYLILHFKKLI